jgi:uncharacterized protein with ParB-like and HNH nuclease domain
MNVPVFNREYSWSKEIIDSISINDLVSNGTDDVEVITGRERLEIMKK